MAKAMGFLAKSSCDILNSTLKSFGVQLIGDELVTKTKPEDFPQKKHNLIQAILYISSCNIS
jgi:hypothetical protein